LRNGDESITQGEIDEFLNQQNKFKKDYFIPPTIQDLDIDPSLSSSEKQEAIRLKKLEVEQEFEKKYFHDLTAYKRWLKHEGKERNLSKKTALDEVIVHLKHDQDLMSLIAPRVNELFKCLFKIPKDGAAWLGYDTTLPEDQKILIQWITNCYEVMIPHLEDKQRITLNNEMFENVYAKCIVGLSIYGFEEEIRDSLTTALSPLQNTIDEQAQASKDAQNTALNKDLADSYLIANDIIDSMESYSLFGHKWVAKLTPHSQKVMSALRVANSNVKSLGILLLQGISISAGDTGVAKIASSLKLYLMDTYMSENGVRGFYENKNRQANLAEWTEKYDDLYNKWEPWQKDIDALNKKVNELHGEIETLDNAKGKGKPHVKGFANRKRRTISQVRYLTKLRKINEISELMEQIESGEEKLIKYKSDLTNLDNAADKLQRDKILLQKSLDKLETDLPNSLSRKLRTLKKAGMMADIKGLNAKIKAVAPEVEEFRVKRLELKASYTKLFISTPEMTVGSESDILDKAIKSAVKNPKKTNWSGTGFTVASVLLNMINLIIVQKSTPKYEDLDFSFGSDSSNAFDTFATISSAAYLGQAITLLFASASNNLIDEVVKSDVLNPKKLKNFYDIRHDIDFKTKGVLRISTSEALKKFPDIEQKKFLTYLKRTKIFYRLLGSFTVIATVYEMAPLVHKTFGRKGNQLNKLEKTLSVIKVSTLAVSIIGGFYSLGLGFGVLAGFAWAVPVLAAVSVVYIISAVALDLIIRDEYERWLDHSRYGTEPLWIDDIDTEYQQLLFLMMNPSVYAQPTYFIKPAVINRGGNDFIFNRRVTTGYYVMLKLPEPNCKVEVAEVIPEWIGGKQGVTNLNLAIINTIWLTDFQYKMVSESGLPNDINAQLTDTKWLDSIDSEDAPKGSLTCLLRLPLVDLGKGYFILRIIRAESNMIWEYRIDIDASHHGQIIKDTFKGTDAWPADITPVTLPLYS